VATGALATVGRVSDLELEGEVVAEEDAEASDATTPVRPLPIAPDVPQSALALRAEVKTAAVAVAGGVLAGAATVAAVRAVSAVGGRTSSSRRRGTRIRRRERPREIVASRSFLVDVHLLGR
jgi:hypothetical protein